MRSEMRKGIREIQIRRIVKAIRPRKFYSPLIRVLSLFLRPKMERTIYQGIYQAVAHAEEKYSAL